MVHVREQLDMAPNVADSSNECMLSTWCAARLAVLFFLELMTTAPGDAAVQSQHMFKFDKDVGLFAIEKAKRNQGIVNWYDLWYNRTENLKRRMNRAFQLQVEIGDMEFGTPQVQPESTKVERLYEATFEGNTRSSSLMEITQTKTVSESSSLETFYGFESNSTSTIEAGIPLILKVRAGYGIEFIIHKVKTEVSETTEEVSLAINVTIPSKKRVTVQWLATKVTTIIPWTVKVKIRGQFVVDFKDSNKGPHQQVYTVTDLVEYFPELKKTGEGEIEYTASGVLKEDKADKLTVKIKEESIR